jgi:chromosome partitioning protein
VNIISFINHKGGVGKTTITAHLGYALVHTHGKRVLCVDFDTQANLTEILGVTVAEHTIADVLAETTSARSAIADVGGVHVLPSSIDLASASFALTANNTQNALKIALEPLRDDYDYIFIDCPPSLEMLTVNAMMASTDVCIVSNAEYLALKGITNIVTVVNEVQLYNRNLALSSVAVSHYDSRKAHNREMLAELRATFGERVLLPPIRVAVAVVESSSHGGTVVNDFYQFTTAFLAHYEHES